MIPSEFWVIVDHEAWDEAILFHGETPQAAEDKAMTYIREAVQEWLEPAEKEQWEHFAFEVGEWSIRNASYKA